jgi:TonB family protein
MLSLCRQFFCTLCSGLAVGVAVAQAASAPGIDESRLPEWVKRQARSPLKVIIESTTPRVRTEASKDNSGPARDPKAAPPRKAAAPQAAPRAASAASAALAAAAPSAASAITAASAAAPASADTPASAATASPPRVALQLLVRVEPELPQEVIDMALNQAEVVAIFVVNTDGSVSQASIASSSDERLNHSILRAVGEWRYAPIDAPRPHGVKFSFVMP